jgi:hypothetical protein
MKEYEKLISDALNDDPTRLSYMKLTNSVEDTPLIESYKDIISSHKS